MKRAGMILKKMVHPHVMTVSIVNLVKFHRLDSPILSAPKALNFVSAMMSVLGLQIAMIESFLEMRMTIAR